MSASSSLPRRVRSPAASFGLHASFTLSDETLEACTAAVADLNGKLRRRYDDEDKTNALRPPRQSHGYHITSAEGEVDQEDSLRKYGKRVVERSRASAS